MSAPAPLRLPRIDAVTAATRSALLAALHGQVLDDARVEVGIATATEADAWVTCGTGVAVAPVAVHGRRVDLNADDGRPDAVAAVTALAALEPVLALVETALGIVLRPDGLSPAPAADTVIIGLTAGPARLLLGVAPGVTLRPAPVAASVDHIGVRWRLCLPGPVLTRAPSAGDLLTGIDASGAIVVAGHALPVGLARSGAGTGLSVIGDWRRTMDNEPSRAGFDPAAVRLPVTVSIDGAVAPIGDLARLAPGSVLPLPGDPARLVVTVLAGGAALASGTLVAVGDGYGVLIDQVFAALPAADVQAG